jgi:ketosteroid isomerase-like protein
MKTALRSIAFLALGTLAGLGQAADDAKAIVDGYMAAWNAHDADRAATFLAEDAVYFDATVGTPQNGKAAARDNVIKVFIGAVPDLKWEMTSAPIVGADGIAFQWKFSGTNSGDWSAASPRKVRFSPITTRGMPYSRMAPLHIAQGDRVV